MKVLNFYHVGKIIPQGAIYIGRSMPHMGLERSKYANPFKVVKSGTKEEQLAARHTAVQSYRRWLFNEIKKGSITLEELSELRHYDLVCFCEPLECHGHVLRNAVHYACTQLNIAIENKDELTL